MESIEYDSVGGCDESKCVSKGRSYLYGDSNTCYGDAGYFFPMMCADGYLPMIVEDEPPYNHSNWYGDIPVSYFTCCPPHYVSSNATNATRQCSDPIANTIDFDGDDDGIIDDVCSNHTQQNPRQMKTSWGTIGAGTFGIVPSKTDSFLCCDDPAPIENDESYLDAAECVPYRNEMYEARRAENVIGEIRLISCDFPEEDFLYPRPFGDGAYDDVAATGRYQCCRHGPALPPFVQDFEFKITVYLPLALWCVTAVASAVVVIALLIPLLLQIKQGAIGFQSSRRSTSVRAKTPCYSTYNLYLVYLSFFDLIFSLFQIGWYGSYINQKFNPNFYHIVVSTSNIVHTINIIRAPDGPPTYTYVFISMWINAIISYQLLVLLKKSKHTRRMDQPRVTRINIQVGVVSLLGVIYGIILHFLSDASAKAGMDGDFEKVETLSDTVKILWLLMATLPVVYVAFICILIWWGDYIPSANSSGECSTRDRAVRQLLFFFMRIVAVCFVVWLPAAMVVVQGIVKYQAWYFLLAWCLVAIQPILSICMALTKYDVRKYIYDLITLSYIFGVEDKDSGFGPKDSGNLYDSSKISRTLVSSSKNSLEPGPPARASVSYGHDQASAEAVYFSVLGFVPDDAKSDSQPFSNSVAETAFVKHGDDVDRKVHFVANGNASGKETHDTRYEESKHVIAKED